MRPWPPWGVDCDIGYVSGLLVDTRVVALLGLRTRRDLISGQVDYDHSGCQILGAYYFRSMLSIYRELLWVALGR